MKALLAGLLLLAAPAFAQTAPPSGGDSLAQFYQWVQTQQANAGVSYSIGAPHVKYACTWWDAVSAGSSGLNVGISTAKDYLDLGPAMATANAAPTRYGQGVATHVGNIWNATAGNLPGKLAQHVKVTSLPDVTLGVLLLEPLNGRLKSWTWKNDAQAALAYRFGGAGN